MKKEKSIEEELWGVFENVEGDKKPLIKPLIEELINLVFQLEEVKKFNFYYQIGNKGRIKITESFRLYKELLNQLNLTTKTLSTFLNKQEKAELSPLEKYIESQTNDF